MRSLSVSLVSVYLGRISLVSAIVAALAAFLYGVFLLMTIMHATVQQGAQANIQILTTQVSTLETQYLHETEAITPTTATQLGFVVPADVSTVYASQNAPTLSLRVAE